MCIKNCADYFHKALFVPFLLRHLQNIFYSIVKKYKTVHFSCGIEIINHYLYLSYSYDSMATPSGTIIALLGLLNGCLLIGIISTT